MLPSDHRSEKKPSRTTRRAFLGGTALAAAAVTVLPRHVLAGSGTLPPSEKLNIAGVGVGGMGGNNVAACKNENIVALCDVDAEGYAAHTIKDYPKATVYKDFRVMLDKQKDIDAVIVAVPDHSHAGIGWRPSAAASTSTFRSRWPTVFTRPGCLPRPPASTRWPRSWATRGTRATACRCFAPGFGTGRSDTSARYMPGRTAPFGRKASKSAAPRKRRLSPPHSIGTSGSDRPPCARITRRIIPATGGRGGISAPGR